MTVIIIVFVYILQQFYSPHLNEYSRNSPVCTIDLLLFIRECEQLLNEDVPRNLKLTQKYLKMMRHQQRNQC